MNHLSAQKMFVLTLCRLEALLEEKLSLVERLGNGNKGFAAAQLRTDAFRQVGVAAWKNPALMEGSKHSRLRGRCCGMKGKDAGGRGCSGRWER